MDEVFRRYWLRIEDERVRRAKDMHAWLVNDRESIVRQVRSSMMKMFRPKTVRRMSVRVLNVVPRVVSRLAKVYKAPPDRVLDGGVTYAVADGGERTAVESKGNKVYRKLLDGSTIDRRMKEAEQQALYFNTVLVQPRWLDDAGGGRMDYVVHNPAFTVVEWDENDFYKPRAMYFPAYRTIDGRPELVLVYWSATEHYYVRKNNTKVVVPGMSGMENPYGVFPAAVLRVTETADGWGDGMWDLVDGNLECCEQVTNISYTAKFQTHGQAVAVNMGLKGEPEIGPDRTLAVDDKTGSTVQPNFFFANANPNIEAVQGLVDWMLRTLQNIRGISGSTMSLDANMQSGVSKIQDSAELMEQRQDFVGTLTQFEADLFAATRQVWNYHNDNQKIPDESVFSVKYPDPKIIKSVDEKTREREFGLKNNTMSHIDIIMEDNPHMTEADAAERFDKIIAERRRINDRYGFFDSTPAGAINNPDTTATS